MRLSATGFTPHGNWWRRTEPTPIFFGSAVDFADALRLRTWKSCAALWSALQTKFSEEFIKDRAKNLLAYIVRWQAKSTSGNAFIESRAKSQRRSIYTLPRGD
jgi:hypothetical protein